jgi:hypothetical protein
MVLQHGNDGVRLQAIKFVETTILLFTPDSNGSPLPPPQHVLSDGKRLIDSLKIFAWENLEKLDYSWFTYELRTDHCLPRNHTLFWLLALLQN